MPTRKEDGRRQAPVPVWAWMALVVDLEVFSPVVNGCWGGQLVENYGQPNHIYFLYHGFVLEDNRQDCLQVSQSHGSGAVRGQPGGSQWNAMDGV